MRNYRKYKPRPLNKLIDSIFHKHFDDPAMVIADGFLHALVDLFVHGDPPERVLKAEIKYNFKPFLRALKKYIKERMRNGSRGIR